LSLPDFNGEPDSSMQVAAMYIAMSQQLGVLQRSITQINLSPRYAWQLRLDNGMSLELGREQMQQRLARFVAVYPYSLATMAGKVNHVDLRYQNGFAASGSAGVKVETKRNSENRV